MGIFLFKLAQVFQDLWPGVPMAKVRLENNYKEEERERESSFLCLEKSTKNILSFFSLTSFSLLISFSFSPSLALTVRHF